MKEVKSEQLPIVDVDGSYLYKKQQRLLKAGTKVASVEPPCPLTGWKIIEESNIQTITRCIPVLTPGMFFHNNNNNNNSNH